MLRKLVLSIGLSIFMYQNALASCSLPQSDLLLLQKQFPQFNLATMTLECAAQAKQQRNIIAFYKQHPTMIEARLRYKKDIYLRDRQGKRASPIVLSLLYKNQKKYTVIVSSQLSPLTGFFLQTNIHLPKGVGQLLVVVYDPDATRPYTVSLSNH